jgi:membrane associated rhomboid family serine protease
VKLPAVTTAVAVLTVFAFAAGDVLFYERGSDDWWRAVTASFAHYDPRHLLMNLVALVVLGTAFEQRAQRSLVLGVVAATVVASMLVIMFLTTDVAVFAGASAINYALFGGLAACCFRQNRMLVIAVSAAAAGYVVTTVVSPGVAGYVLVWEVHVVGAAIGATLTVLTGKLPSVLAQAPGRMARNASTISSSM